MQKQNGMVYALLVVLVLMAAVIVVQQERIKEMDITTLPFCDYSTVIAIQGQDHEGYYVGLDADHKIVCAQSLIKEGAVVDFGL